MLFTRFQKSMDYIWNYNCVTIIIDCWSPPMSQSICIYGYKLERFGIGIQNVQNGKLFNTIGYTQFEWMVNVWEKYRTGWNTEESLVE